MSRLEDEILTINEVRRGLGLGELVLPDGGRDPDGELTLTEFVNQRLDAVNDERKRWVERATAILTLALRICRQNGGRDGDFLELKELLRQFGHAASSDP